MPAANSGGGVAGERKRGKAAAGLGAARVAPRGSDASVGGRHMKKKVESQVVKMLQNGIIQHSSSSFSSLVLLVKKKDHSWCFRVDYMHLNVIVKSKYPTTHGFGSGFP
jgi:hypothetical protein